MVNLVVSPLVVAVVK